MERDRVEVFVRDRGPGFDPAPCPADRRGLRESIVGRMERHGGRAAIHTAPGRGHRGRAGAVSDASRRASSTTTGCSAPACAPSSTAWSTCVADAANVAEAVDGIAEHEPDVVLLDVHMPDGGGAEVIRRGAEAPAPQFLAL